MRVSTMPEHLKRRTPRWHTGTFIAILIFAAWASLEVFTDTWDSYAFVTGERATVTVLEPCAGEASRYHERPDICQGRWVYDGREVRGTVHLRTEVADVPARPFEQRAAVHGGTAFLPGGTATHVIGLLAPWLVLAAALALTVLVRFGKRRERRRQAAVREWRAGRDVR